MVRIDMSEYMEKHSVSRLIGAPPGYVGYEEGGQLTEAVRRRPYSVLLFDEIEKANPDVFNVFLQIMDDGRLTDGKGRVVDFKNTILIMTSNIGSLSLSGDLTSPERFQRASEQVMTALRGHFKPEFLNRIDDIVVFRPLGTEQLTKIVDLRLQDLRELLVDRKVTLEPLRYSTGRRNRRPSRKRSHSSSSQNGATEWPTSEGGPHPPSFGECGMGTIQELP